MDNTQRCIDAVWTAVREEAAEIAAREPLLARLIDEVILSRRDLFESLSVRLSRKLGRNAIGEGDLYTIFMDAFSDDEATINYSETPVKFSASIELNKDYVVFLEKTTNVREATSFFGKIPLIGSLFTTDTTATSLDEVCIINISSN